MDTILQDYYNKGEFNFGKLIDTKFTKDLRKAIDEFLIYKYIWRWKDKNGVEDLKKAGYYLEDLIKLLEE